MRVMGIDPGLTRLGFGVVEKNRGRLTAVTDGTIVTPAGGSTSQRLLELFDRITETIMDLSPNAVCIERLFFNLNAKTAVPVIQASGVALVAAARAGAEVHEYTPLEVKSAVVGNGTATKDQVRFMVEKLLSMKGSPSGADAADALALAVCHINSMGLKRAAEARS
jgi:crossover junction endodeoxyribonuclease RuvC